MWKKGTFEKCKSLKEISIPDGVVELGPYCFSGCSSLERIDLPKTLKTIGKRAFCSCKSLKELIIPDGITEIPGGSFGGVFEGCTSLITVRLPETLTMLGQSAFGYCYRLASIVIPGSVKEIGPKAFWECYDLTRIELPDGLEVIGEDVFGCCNSLKSVSFPKTVKSVGKNAFWSCYGLREAIVPDGVEIEKAAVFGNCPNLWKKTGKELPSRVTLELLSDPFECECFLNLSGKDVQPYMNEHYSDPLDDGFESRSFLYVKWGQYREVTLDGKDISVSSLFFRPMEYGFSWWRDHDDDLQAALSDLKPGCYGVIDRREMYKSRTVFSIELKGVPFNKYCLQLLRMARGNWGSPTAAIQNKLIPDMGLSCDKILYCGVEIDGEFQEDMGSQGKTQRFVFYKNQDGFIKMTGEYAY